MVNLLEQTGDQRIADSPETLHCVLEQDTLSALRTGSTQEDKKSSQHDWKIVDSHVKHQH